MSWFKETIFSSIGRKLLMSLTGLFLCSFLVIHLVGNLQLFSHDNGESFNKYSKFMTSNPLIKSISYFLYLSIILHSIDGLWLWYKNKKARPIGYAVWKANQNSMWSSRNMGILGTIILIFIVIHMRTFWWEYHNGTIPQMAYEGESYKNLYGVTLEAFSQWWYTVFYVISMIALGFHLIHGFKSGFQTLGLSHKKYTPIIETVGILFAILIPAAFASMPIYLYIIQLQ